ncbi:MAG: hypothetical protein V8T46_06475 [Sutterella seckii]
MIRALRTVSAFNFLRQSPKRRFLDEEPSTHRGPHPGFSRRIALSGAAGAAGAAAGTGTIGAALWTAYAHEAMREEVEALKADGWEAILHLQCVRRLLRSFGASQEGCARFAGNGADYADPTHPQRGCCARGAQAMWVWNHPLRLKKPLKRVGERGEGKFKDTPWD